MAAGNEQADELAKEGARDDSFQSILCDTYKGAVETCKANHRLHWRFHPSKRKEESDGLTWLRRLPQGWDEKDERWKRAKTDSCASSCPEAHGTTLVL